MSDAPTALPMEVAAPSASPAEVVAVRAPRIRPGIATLLLFATSAFLVWLLLDWIYALQAIRGPANRPLYLSWIVLHLVNVPTFCAAFLVLLKARLRWTRIILAPLLLLASTLIQLVALGIYREALPDPGETLLVWLGVWMTPSVLACMAAAAGVTLVAAVFAGLIAVVLTRSDGDLADFRLVFRNWARSLLANPITLFFGPIFVKDVRVSGRRPSTYWMRGLYALALLGLVSLLYFAISAEVNAGWASPAQRLQELQQLAPALAVSIGWFQYALLTFLAAAITAPSICEEKRTRTLSALMTTPMTSAQIIFGKLASSVGLLFILALISVPFLLAVRIFGGLEAEFVLAMTAISLSSALFMASLGILFSIWCRKSGTAANMAIFSYLALTIGPVLLLLLLTIRGGGPGGPPEEIIIVSSPVTLFGITSQILGSGPNLPIRLMWTINSGLNVVFALLASLVAAGALRRVMLADPAPAAPKRGRRVRRAAASPVPSIDPTSPETPDPALPTPAPVATEEVFVERDTQVWDQPVLWREMRQPAIGSRRNLVVASVLITAALLWLYSEAPPGQNDCHPIVLSISSIILCFAAALSSTSSISGEKEASTWLVLLTTPLRARDILGAKLIGAIRRQWFLGAAVLIHMIIGIVAGGIHPIALLHVAMIFVTVAALLAATGLFFSLLVKRPIVAMLLNLMLAGFLWVGLLILVSLLGEFAFRGGQIEDQLLDFALAINPVYMAVTAVIAAASTDRMSMYEFRYDMPTGDLGVIQFTTLLTGFCAVGVCVGLLVFMFACRMFVRRSGRAS